MPVFASKATASGSAGQLGQEPTLQEHAERKGGRLLTEMSKTGERADRGQPEKVTSQPATLNDLGISRSLSSRWQQSGTVSDEDYPRTTVEELYSHGSRARNVF